MHYKSMINTNNLSEPKHGAVRRAAEDNALVIEKEFKDNTDIVVRRVTVQGRLCVLSYCDGLCDSLLAGQSVLYPILNFNADIPKTDTADFVSANVAFNTDCKTLQNLDDSIRCVLSGNIVVFFDGDNKSLAFSIQKYPSRSVDEPDTEVQESAAKEGFVENLRVNTALMRKRVTTTDLKMEEIRIGKTSKTRVLVCYMAQKVEKSLLSEVRKRLDSIDLDIVLDSRYLSAYLNDNKRHMFSMVGDTERPDVLVAKLNEGKIGLIVDGTPFALVVPYFFIENFQTLDDYINKPYFASMIRILRFVCFISSIILPGAYVAVGLFHQELLPDDMLYSIVVSESNTMFPLMVEALIIHFIYEIVREAGLRMPKSVGQAVSIVGAIVIGDAAVTAGLIGAPMLIIVAITAVSSTVVSDLYQPLSILRLVFIIIGGVSGLYGIVIGLSVLIISMCSIQQYGSSYLSPFLPFDKAAFRDTFIRTKSAINSKYIFNIGKAKKTDRR